MRWLFIDTLFMLFTFRIFTYAQDRHYFAKTMIAGTSLTYIWNKDEHDILQSELTWNLNIGISLSKRIFSGIQVLNIYTWETYQSKKYSNIYGIFTQYNFLRGTNHRFFAEISVNSGNYDYFLTDSLNFGRRLFFTGVGFGYDLPIKFIHGLYLDISFINYYFLNQFDIESDYTQYILGLNYRFYEK